MYTANNVVNNAGANPMNYATRIYELTVYEKLIKYAVEMKALFESGNEAQLKIRAVPLNAGGACSYSTFFKYVDVFYPLALGSRTARTQMLKEDLEKLVDAGFFEIGLGNKGSLIYKLTDLYKTQDVNELIEG
ncbi:hypothetical protein G3J10_004452 [Salmonella enterica]|nr:hypothetical protein [Salmonella enterica]